MMHFSVNSGYIVTMEEKNIFFNPSSEKKKARRITFFFSDSSLKLNRSNRKNKYYKKHLLY